MQVLEVGSRKIGSAREVWLFVWLDNPNGLDFSPVCGAGNAAKMPLDGGLVGLICPVFPQKHTSGVGDGVVRQPTEVHTCFISVPRYLETRAPELQHESRL